MQIVIVDDEAFSVQWMEQLIRQTGNDHQVAATFPNGELALSYLRQHPAEVLITDIRMPVMDGLALLTAIREEHIPVYPIIISAYDEFTYAREAMKLGVSTFLLKAELTVEEVREALCQAQESHKGIPRNPELLPAYVEALAAGDNPPPPFDAAAELRFLMVTVAQRTAHHRAFELLQVLLSSCQISPIMQASLSDHRLLHVFPFEPHQPSSLARAWPATQAYLPMVGILTHGAGESCAPAIRQALQLSQRQQYYQRLTFFDATMPHPTHIPPLPPAGSWMDWLSAHFSAAADTLADPDELIGHISRFAAEVYAQYKETAPMAVSRLMDALRPARTLHAMEKSLRAILEAAEEEARARQLRSPAISSAVRFIEENYAHPLDLRQIAAHVHLTKNYLSTLFKKEMGIGLIEFLQDHRLAQSRTLLLQQGVSVQEAAYAVGIRDPAYFSRLYREKYGVPPSSTQRTGK